MKISPLSIIPSDMVCKRMNEAIELNWYSTDDASELQFLTREDYLARYLPVNQCDFLQLVFSVNYSF